MTQDHQCPKCKTIYLERSEPEECDWCEDTLTVPISDEDEPAEQQTEGT